MTLMNGGRSVLISALSIIAVQPTNDFTPTKSPDVLDVAVLRSKSAERLTKYFVISVVLLVILGNIMMGCEVSKGICSDLFYARSM